MWFGILDVKVLIQKLKKCKINFYVISVWKSSLRYISNKYLRQRFEMPALKDRRTLASLCYLYKVLNGLENNQEFLEKLSFNTSRQSRKKCLFYVPSVRTELEKGLPLYRMTRLANEFSDLPFFCKSLRGFITFTKKIIT